MSHGLALQHPRGSGLQNEAAPGAAQGGSRPASTVTLRVTSPAALTSTLLRTHQLKTLPTAAGGAGNLDLTWLFIPKRLASPASSCRKGCPELSQKDLFIFTAVAPVGVCTVLAIGAVQQS